MVVSVGCDEQEGWDLQTACGADTDMLLQFDACVRCARHHDHASQALPSPAVSSKLVMSSQTHTECIWSRMCLFACTCAPNTLCVRQHNTRATTTTSVVRVLLPRLLLLCRHCGAAAAAGCIALLLLCRSGGRDSLLLLLSGCCILAVLLSAVSSDQEVSVFEALLDKERVAAV